MKIVSYGTDCGLVLGFLTKVGKPQIRGYMLILE